MHYTQIAFSILVHRWTHTFCTCMHNCAVWLGMHTCTHSLEQIQWSLMQSDAQYARSTRQWGVRGPRQLTECGVGKAMGGMGCRKKGEDEWNKRSKWCSAEMQNWKNSVLISPLWFFFKSCYNSFFAYLDIIDLWIILDYLCWEDLRG